MTELLLGLGTTWLIGGVAVKLVRVDVNMIQKLVLGLDIVGLLLLV
jgi:hypothetical protein